MLSRSLGFLLVAAGLILFVPGVAQAGPEARCAMCHEFHSDVNRVGPSLKSVFGRKAGTARGFAYMFTKYVKGEPWAWDEAHLRAWMDDARQAIKDFTGNPHARTRMPALHVRGADADAVIAFLKQLK